MKRRFPPVRSLAAPAAAVVMVGLIAASLIWLKDYRPFGSPQPATAMTDIGLRLGKVELAGRADGKRAWRMQARQVEVSRDRLTTVFTSISNGVVYDHDKPAANLKAARVTYSSFNKDLVAEGGIKMTASNKMAVGTDALKWSFLTRKLTCPTKLSFAMGAARGSADSLDADLANDVVLIRKVNLRFPSNEQAVRLK
jgi:hypothetical protein